MTHEEQEHLIALIKSKVPPIGWTVLAWNIGGFPKQIRIAKHDMHVSSSRTPPILQYWLINSKEEWLEEYEHISMPFPPMQQRFILTLHQS